MFSWQARILLHSVLGRLLCFGSWIRNGRGLAYHVVLATHKILILHPLPDNLPLAVTPLFALPDHQVLVLEGPDASAFAQAQFANDVLALPVGHWQWNAWLTPKGRVIAVFALLKPEDERLLLVMPDADAAELATQLQRFVFRRKLKVTADAGWQVAGSFNPPASAQTTRIGAEADSLELDYGSSPRNLQLVPATTALALDTDAIALWRVQDLQHGLPRLSAAQREQWTAQQLSLERLPAFSVKKGCYPGQEIVARTHFLGKAKRAATVLQVDPGVLPGSEVLQAGQAIGTIVAVAAGSPSLALAVLPLDAELAKLQAGGHDATPQPFVDGLAR